MNPKFPHILPPPPPQVPTPTLLTFRSTPKPMATTTPACGWVDLPKCKKRCWFAHLPAPESFRNYVAIMDDFGADLEKRGHKFQHLMIWCVHAAFHLNFPRRSRSVLNVPCSIRICRELGHKTTKRSKSSTPVDKTYHITALVSPDMTVGRFRAFAVHIYISGEIPRAKYFTFSSTYTVIRRGNREKRVVDTSKALAATSSCRVPPRRR